MTKKSGSSKLDTTLEQIRQLAWTGQHAAAIDSATQALENVGAGSSRPAKGRGNLAPTQMSLLDLRSESYIALGSLDLAMQDAKAMIEIGRTSNVKGLQAQALNKLALVQMRTGDMKVAIRLATSAVKLRHNDSQLRATSFFRLSEAQMRSYNMSEPAIENAQKAIALFETSSDLSSIGRASWSISLSYADLGKADESRRAAQNALDYCKRAGDQYGIGNAYNALTFTEADLAIRKEYCQQMLQAFELAGYQDRIAVAILNLSLIYSSLGLQLHARRLLTEGMQMNRAIGIKYALANSLASLISTEINLGNLDRARTFLPELQKLTADIDELLTHSNLASTFGNLAFAEGDPKKAVRHFKSAAKFIHDLGLARAHQQLTELAIAQLASGDPIAALKTTTKATDLHRAQDYAMTDNSSIQSIWWWHAQTLAANKKQKAARDALERAYGFLIKMSANLRDIGLRRNLLNKVEDNRKILKFWVEDGTKRKLPKERIFAHLNIESNLREPFQRLADSGLRLNTLHTVEDIQTFLVEEATELSGGERVMLILEKDGKRKVTKSILPLPSYYSGKGYEKTEDPKDVLKRISKYLDHARQTRTTQLTMDHGRRTTKHAQSSTVNHLARIVAPLIAQNQLLGYLYVDMSTLYGTFDDTDRDMMSMLANQGAVALDNAALLAGLERKIQERTQELQAANASLEQSNAELSIINSVQEGLADKLNMQAIYELVGEKIRETFNAEVMDIVTYDSVGNLLTNPYSYEKGDRTNFEPRAPYGFRLHVIQSRKSLLLENDVEKLGALYNNPIVIGEMPKTALFVPILLGDSVKGVISLQDLEREHAYNQSDVRLLETLANSMGMALENARLFAETEQRNAGLAIINSVQEGLASKLDLQAIYNLVGDKIQEIFDAQVVDIGLLDRNDNMIHFPYTIERGVHFPDEPLPIMGFRKHVMETRQPILINTDVPEMSAKYGNPLALQGESPKSDMFVPMILDNQSVGVISIQNLDKENAFSESDVNLLVTLASSLSVALENARLFAETEERNAELAIINSVQEGLASKLDILSIYELVGDRIREVFNAQVIDIVAYDKQTNLLKDLFSYENGDRSTLPDRPPKGYRLHVIKTKKTLVINKDLEKRRAEFGQMSQSSGAPAKSVVFTPLITGEEVTGIISLQNLEDENAFTPSSVRLLETLASSMSVALENARLFNAEQRRVAELAAISKVTQALVAESELESTIQLIGNQMREIFNADIAYLALLDAPTGTINFHYQYGEEFPQRKLGEGLTSKILLTGEPLLINKDVVEQTIAIGATIVGKEALSYLGVPIKSGGETIGVISVQSTMREGVFNEDSLRLLNTIAASAGAAIHNAQLHDETRRRERETSALLDISRDISSSLDLNEVLEEITSHAKELLNGDLSALFLPDEDGITFRAITAIGEFADELRQDATKLGEGLLGDIARTKVGEIINDTMSDPRTVQIKGTEETAAEHLLAVPLLANEELKGLMAVWRTGKGMEFVEAELEFLTGLSRQAVIAVQNAQLFSEAEGLRVAAEQANTAKSAFMANMSHELRTPLNAIIGFTRIVRRKGEDLLPEKQLENLDKVLSSSEHLLGLINTVLDIAKIEAGRMDVLPVKFTVETLIDQCVNLASPLLKPGVTLKKHTGEGAFTAHTDQDKIKQIILNLLSNAAKFTHHGSIDLSITRDETFIHVAVKDSGIGITEEALGKVFEEFQQADNTTTRKYGGTGLGLAISRNLARLLGGDLTASSEYGKGSTFTLTIPIQYGTKPASSLSPNTTPIHRHATTPKADANRKLILVIDDDPDATYLLRENLGHNEFEIVGAQNGIIGQEKARQLKPHAILLDILMPDKDGWQVLHDLKNDPETASIPVILLTIVDKKALGMRLGAADYLLKPLNPAEVVTALHKVIKPKKHGHIRVLTVDDDPHIAEMLSQQLPESEFKLISASDGEAGLAAVEAEHPDVILLDIMMPKLDGFAVIERLREKPETRELPIIVISAKELTDEETNRLRESVAIVMRKQGFDGEKLAQEIKLTVQ